jgi:hypothetical protein
MLTLHSTTCKDANYDRHFLLLFTTYYYLLSVLMDVKLYQALLFSASIFSDRSEHILVLASCNI